MRILLFTTETTYTFEKATEIANRWSKAESSIDGDIVCWNKEYNTAIKSIPADPSRPEECWAVSNMFDPRVIR